MEISKKLQELFDKGNTNNKFRYLNFSNPNDCTNYYKEFAAELAEALQPENNPFNNKNKNLIFIYSWEDELNAYSCATAEEDIIRVNEGSIYRIYKLFYNLVSKVKIGLIESNVLHTELIANVSFSNELVPDKPLSYEMIITDNVKLNNIAEYMSMLALKFLIAHELGHSYNGHAGYSRVVIEKIKGLKEKTNLDISELEPSYLDLQTLEMDADIFAINKIVDIAMDMLQTNDKITSYLNESNLIKLILYSIHGIFYLIRNMDLKNYKYKVHPPTYIREALIIDSMVVYLEKRYNTKLPTDFFKDYGVIDKYFYLAENKTNDEFLKYIIDFKDDASVHAENIMHNFRNKVSHNIKEGSRLPIEGIDY